MFSLRPLSIREAATPDQVIIKGRGCFPPALTMTVCPPHPKSMDSLALAYTKFLLPAVATTVFNQPSICLFVC